MAIYSQRHPGSKNLEAISYSTDTKILRVLYRSGYLYFFYDVQKYIYDQIANGGGKIAWQLLPNYSYRQINRNYSIQLSAMFPDLSYDEIVLLGKIMENK